MSFQDQSIKRKAMSVIMLTSVAVLLLTATAFTVYDLATYRQNLAGSLSATAAIIADHSTAALTLRDAQDARATLASLRADPRIVAAALYDRQGKLFARYPLQAPDREFPPALARVGWRSEGGRVLVFMPVTEGSARLGTLYLRSSPYPLYRRLQMYGGLVLTILCGSVLVALAISNTLQRWITRPVLALAAVAKAVSERGDYSIRAQKLSGDEMGLLTDAFNQMLGRIEEQTEVLRQHEEIRSFLAAIVESSNDAIIGKDFESKVISWNTGAERMFGYAAAEMLGQPITRLQSPDRPEEEASILEEVKRGRTRHYETMRIRKDGRPIKVSLSVSPIKNSHGEIIGVSSIVQDITERKRAERELPTSSGRLWTPSSAWMPGSISPFSMKRRSGCSTARVEKRSGNRSTGSSRRGSARHTASTWPSSAAPASPVGRWAICVPSPVCARTARSFRSRPPFPTSTLGGSRLIR